MRSPQAVVNPSVSVVTRYIPRLASFLKVNAGSAAVLFGDNWASIASPSQQMVKIPPAPNFATSLASVYIFRSLPASATAMVHVLLLFGPSVIVGRSSKAASAPVKERPLEPDI